MSTPGSPSAHTKDPFFGLRILQPNEDPSLPPKRILNYKDGTELVYIPPGPFMMGDDELDKQGGRCPRHEVYLDGYYMAVWPVTNKQYRRYMRETGQRAPDGHWWEADGGKRLWVGTRLLSGHEEHPVVCVDWNEAEAYAKWATLRMPSEAEWEKAAGGPEGQKYPWGNEWEEGRCRYGRNRGEGTTAEVKEYVSGLSVYGCEQMSGNVWEWCGDWYGEISYDEGERRNPKGPESRSNRVYRGGSWNDPLSRARVAVRGWGDPSWRFGFLGFRVARSFP